MDVDNVQKIYSLGFKTNLSKEPVIFYVNSKKDINSSKIVLDLIDELLRPKYEHHTFYCPNLGGYDVVFLVKVLIDYNELNNDKYKIDTVFRDTKVLKLTLSKKVNFFFSITDV